MKKAFCILAVVLSIGLPAQWTPVNGSSASKGKERFYKLELGKLRRQLKMDVKANRKSGIEIVLPTGNGQMERFEVYSNPVVERSLAERYELGSYAGAGIDDVKKKVHFSISPYGFQAMVEKDGELEFLEPIKPNSEIYSLHPKRGKGRAKKPFCETKEHKEASHRNKVLRQRTSDKGSDGFFRTLRLAVSTTGEYTNFFGGVPQAFAAINATITRVNAIFERDFATKLILQDFPQLIYTDPKADPYSDSEEGVSGKWSGELMDTLHDTIGDDTFDIGHLFSSEGGGGFAGDIGTVCSNDQTVTDEGIYKYKGSAYTSPDHESGATPQGDTFDIDYVAHEMAHQLGATHTFSYVVEGTGTSVEPGSGSTIMGYAGITTTADVQMHSDSYFHKESIAQVRDFLRQADCDAETAITNKAPRIKPLSDKTIPKQTAFVLTAEVSDDEGDPLNYAWEQVDDAQETIIKITGNETSGALFRSLPPMDTPTRYFPKFDRVLKGSLTNPSDWESVSNIPREMNFALTVRDNHPRKEEQQVSVATQRIVVGNDGPFRIINAEVYNNVPTPINWSVANTNKSPYDVENVKIDYSTDGGDTWVQLIASTPNDGTEIVSFPSGLSSGRMIFVRVSAIGNVFYAVNSAKVTAAVNCSDSSAIEISYSHITKNSVQISWNHMAGASYRFRYKSLDENAWKEQYLNGNFVELTGLKEGSVYQVQVASVCSGNQKDFGKTSYFVTALDIPYCSVSVYDSEDEYISNVTLANVNNDSKGSKYMDYTADVSKFIRLESGGAYTLSVRAGWKGKKSKKAVKAWIDFNRNGFFEEDEIILNPKVSDTEELVSGNFKVPDNAIRNAVLKMRVILKYDTADIKPCDNFSYGEVEDYAVVVAAWKDILSTSSVVIPNVTDGILKISNIPNKVPYKIYDISGRLMLQGNTGRDEIPVHSLRQGVYVFSFKYGGKHHNIKFLKR